MGHSAQVVNRTGSVRISDITVLLVTAVAGFWFLFAGFGLGDDAAYARLAAHILEGGYPAQGETAVFTSRPLLLYAVAASLALFSWNEVAFVLPTMVAAVGCVLSVYVIATLLADRVAGIIAAATLIVSPLHLAYATTLCNDIIGAGLIGVGVSLVLVASRMRRSARCTLIAVAGGVLAGASLAVKLSFGLVLLPVIAILSFGLRRGADQPPWLVLAAAIGCGLSVTSLLAFFWATAGHPLSGMSAEMVFNRRFILPGALTQTLPDVLSFYPRIALGLAPVGPPGHQWSPTGLLFPAAVIAALDGWRRGRASEMLMGVGLLGMFLMLQFWPLQLIPQYVPIHRQPRFLYPLTLPAVVLVSLAARRWLAGTAVHRAVAIAALLVHGATGGWWGARAVGFHADAMSDLRFSAGMAARSSGPVASDAEMLDYLWFRTRGVAPDAQFHLLGEGYRGSRGTLAFVGGSRRPELDPAVVARDVQRSIPPDWLKIADMPGASGPARRLRGAVYVITSGHVPRGSGELTDACPPSRTWILRDVVDVGDPQSEAAHGYHVDRATWHGDRAFRSGAVNLWDDGRAFVGFQTFTVGPLDAAMDLCLVKRIDTGVGGQVSRWDVDGQPAATAKSEAGLAAGWGVVSVLLPGHLVRKTHAQMKETFVSSHVDVNAFRVEVYQSDSGR